MARGRPRKYATEEESQKVIIEKAIKWRIENRERYLENEKKRRDNDTGKIKSWKKRWVEANKDKVNETRRLRAIKRRKEDPVYRFKCIVRGLIKASFTRKQKYKRSRTEELLGCTIEYFQEYILSQCPEGISLKDFGKYGYHIDHIIPISSAKTEDEIIKLCNYTNFQPLFWKENIQKSNKIVACV